jgi:hypothetical protein
MRKFLWEYRFDLILVAMLVVIGGIIEFLVKWVEFLVKF